MTFFKDLLPALGEFFMYALTAVFAQNVIFTRALGVSRLVKLVDDDNTDSLIFGALLLAIQLISTPIAYFINKYWLTNLASRAFLRPLVFILCSIVAFIVVMLLAIAFWKKKGIKEILAVLPMATFNCCVLGTLLIATKLNFTVAQMMGFALGTSIGYILAVALVTEGERRLQSRHVPDALRGLPIALIYIGILSLVIYGFTGHVSVY